MKKTFTMLKGASVVLLAATLGTSCQKQAELPKEEIAAAQASFNQSGDEARTYVLVGATGEIGQVQVIRGRDDLAEVRISASAELAASNPSTLHAEIVDDKGGFFAELKSPAMGGGSLDSEGGEQKGYYSVTFPVISRATGDAVRFEKLILLQGYAFVLSTNKGEAIAKVVIE
jgi:hypothetical protein